MYVIEAKLMHVEMNHPWTPLLDRHFKLCIAAAKRGVGPRKKAPEVPENTWTNGSTLTEPFEEGTKVGHARLLFACGVHWMLREIELAELSTEDVSLDPVSMSVRLNLKQSKIDTEAYGITRTLQCICNGACDLKCPYRVLEVLVSRATLRGTDRGRLAQTDEGKTPTKAEIVKDWQTLFGIPATGHSARRTGALQYIRSGWAVSQVGYLGRWKSSVILEYAQEALESMAVNCDFKFGKNDLVANEELVEKNLASLLRTGLHTKEDTNVQEALALKLRVELESFKHDSDCAQKKLQEAMDSLEHKFVTGMKYLPKLVKSDRYKVVHANSQTLVSAPAAFWKTLCGWMYYNSVYVFEEGDDTKVTCEKCKAALHTKELGAAALAIGPDK